MATFGQAAPAVAVDPSTGLTHMVWNQDGQVWSAYYDPVAKHWVDAAAIPGSVSGQSLQLNANVGMLGADGNVTSGLIATWTNGDGNEAEVNGAVALSSPLGGYQWSQPIGLTDDNLEDSNLQVAVTDDGRVTIVTRKIDADDAQAHGHLSTSTLTLHQQDLTFDGGPRAAYVLGADLPYGVGFNPSGTYVQNFNFDVGYKYKGSQGLLPGGFPLLGGTSTQFEFDLRFRGGYQEMDPSLAGFGPYTSLALARFEAKMGWKFFDMLTLAGYVQGLGAYGGDSGDFWELKGARLNVGLQAKLEYPLWGSYELWPGMSKNGGISLSGGWVFDLRIQWNNLWRDDSTSSGELGDVPEFATLVREDGSPAVVGDDPSQLHWQIEPLKFFNAIFPSSDSAAAEDVGANLTHHTQWQISPGPGLWAQAKISKSISAKATGIIYVDFNSTDGSALSYSDLRLRVDAEATLGSLTLRFRYENNFLKPTGTELEGQPVNRAYAGELEYAPRPTGGVMLAPGAVAGSAGAGAVPHSLTKLADGTMVMVWVQDAPNDSGHLTDIAASTSTDGGTTWSTPTILPGSDGLNLDPVVAVDGQGRVVVAWNNADDSNLAHTPPGHAYVVFGGSNLAGTGTLELDALNGHNGFVLTGGTPLSGIGSAVSGAGDLNGDGVADFVVGAPDALVDSGEAYVVFGKAGLGASGSIDVSTLDGTNGFIVKGASFSQLGTSVHRAGDVNGDGFEDLIIGAPGAGDRTTDGDGSAYVILGHSGGFGTNGIVDVSQLNGSNGFSMGTGVRYDGVGTTVGGGADLNGDGRVDMVIGAPGVSGGNGAYYVVYGAPTLGSSGEVDLSSLNGSNGVEIIYSNNQAGQSTQVPLGDAASLTGDLNGDGEADLILATEGQAFVVFGGGEVGTNGTLDLYQPGATKVLTIDGTQLVGFGSFAVSQAGDVNGDGFQDLIVGVAESMVDGETVPGSSYVIFGSADLQDSTTLALEDLDGTNGFAIEGAGTAVSGGADLNQDGFADLVLGDPAASVGDKDMAGKAYVLFGSATLGASGTVDITTLPAGSLLQLNGAQADDSAGAAVKSITDVNGDGIPDLIIGAPQTINQTDLDDALAALQTEYAVLSGGVWSAASAIAGVELGPKTQSNLQALSDGSLLLVWVADSPADDGQQQVHGVFWNGSWGTPFVIATGIVSESYQPRIVEIGSDLTVIWSEVVPDATESNNDALQINSSTYDGTAWSAPAAANIAPALIPTQVYSDNQQLVVRHGADSASLVKVADTVVREQDDTVQVRITRTGDLSKALTVNYATKDGSATAGSDYQALGGTVTFAAGESERLIEIDIEDDSVAERRGETFDLRVWSGADDAFLAHGAVRLDGPAEVRATVTIIDDEPTQLAAIGSGFVLETDANKSVGQSVAAAGDVNGDGIADFLIGGPGGNDGAGKVYVLYGSHSIGTADANLDVDTLNGTNGTVLNGTIAQGQMGMSLTAADFDKDGRSDIAIGAPQMANNLAAPGGAVYVVHGNSVSGASKDLDSTTAKELTSTTQYSLVGSALASGDVNGDGTVDLVVGAPGMNKVFVVYGQALAGTGTLNLETMTAAQGFELTNGTGFAGASLAVADLDGDGKDDILVGAPNANPVDAGDDDIRGMGGQVYVVFGGSGIGTTDLSALNGTNGVILQGQHYLTDSDDPDNPDFTFADSAGASVAYAGDINGDGKDDVIIGAPHLSPDAVPSLGGAYVLFGGSSWRGNGGTYQLANVNGTNGFVANGVPAGSDSASGGAGMAVSSAGDLNGDGLADLLVGAPTLNTQGDNSNTGQVSVLFGTKNWQPFLDGNSLDLSSVPLDSRVFSFNGTVLTGNTGVATTNAGDVNGDGQPDILIGGPTAGQAYVSFGRPWMGPGGSLDVSKLRSDTGFVYSPGGSEVAAVRSAGDLNGDGYTDMLVAQAGPGGMSSGQFDIVFGSDPQTGLAP